MNNGAALTQAFDIWYSKRPDFTKANAVEANAGDQYRILAEKIFFSNGFAFKRWLITSGFQGFLDSKSTDVDDNPDDWDYEPPKHISEREQATKVIQDLFRWMQANEKELKHPNPREKTNE